MNYLLLMSSAYSEFTIHYTFKKKVWIALIASLLSVIVTLFYFSQVHLLPLDVSKLKLGSQQQQFQPAAVKSISVKEVVTYVLGTLLNQGYHFLKRMNIAQ